LVILRAEQTGSRKWPRRPRRGGPVRRARGRRLPAGHQGDGGRAWGSSCHQRLRVPVLGRRVPGCVHPVQLFLMQ
jgi:hypothetical protein